MVDREPAIVLARASHAFADMARPGLTLRAEHGLGIGKVQILGPDADATYARILGRAPPAARTQIGVESLCFAWLAPNAWLVTGEEAAVAATIAKLNAEGGGEILAVDRSHAEIAISLSGPDARAAIATHCPLDLCERVFPIGAVARSLLGDTGLFLARLTDVSDGPRFRIIVDQTMADYAVRMLAGTKSLGAWS